MARQTIASPKSVRAFLEELCARNVAVDVQYEHRGERMGARARLLALEEDSVCIDRPQRIGSPVHLYGNQRVVVYFLHNGTRHAFRTRVLKPTCLVALNRRQRVVGVRLCVPEHVREQQRRSEFRVSLASHDVKGALHPVVDGDITCCPVDTERFIGRLADVSAGGMGVVVQRTARRAFAVDEEFFVQFSLPDAEEPLVLIVRVRHFRLVSRDTAHRVGLAFVRCDAINTRAQNHAVNKFVAAEQRRQLRRGR